jgi:tetratricopeptide (TPR) repeat protein
VDDQAKGIEHLQESLDIYQKLGDKRGAAIIRGNLANQFRDIGRSAEAIEQYEQAIALHKEVGNRQSECHDTYNLADLRAELGEHANARRLAENARQIAHSIGYRLIESAATCLLADLMAHESRFVEAIRIYDEARALADDVNAVQMQMMVRRQLAWACLLSGDLPRACTAAEEAAKYRYPNEYASVAMLCGVVALRQGDTATACRAFETALSESAAQLAGTARAYGAAYAKALGLAGLALCQDAVFAAAAAEAYRDARTISAAPGIVEDALRQLDALAVADPAGTLKPVRAALDLPRVDLAATGQDT